MYGPLGSIPDPATNMEDRMSKTKRIKTVNSIIISILIFGMGMSARGQQTGSQMDQQQSRSAIEGIAAKLADGLIKHDAAALAALFAADGILVSPFGVQSGRQAIQQSYEQMFRRLEVKQYTHTVELVHEIGTNQAYGVGHWEEMSVPAGRADPIHLSGYWGTLYEKQSDDWKITMNSWSLAPPHQPLDK
jgi:uncharacterized protein (TIGR02246 family)